MNQIRVPFQSDYYQYCTASNTLNQYYCYRDGSGFTYHQRDTFQLQGEKLIKIRSDYNQYSYNVEGYENIDHWGVAVYPELSQFWFPLISCIAVGFIFYMVAKIIFKRFIK